MSRTHAIFAITGALIVVGALVFKPSARADAPRVPTEPGEVLERLPHDADARRRAELRRALSARPEDLQMALRLARLDIQASRARADPRYLGQAQAALTPWWDSASPPQQVLLLRATIRQSLHDFDGALMDLDRVVALAPGDPQAWLTRSVVLSVRGRFAEAKTSCAPLARLSPGAVFTVCDAGVDALTGRAAIAYDRIRRVLEGVTDPDLRQWALSTLAEIAARLGRDDDATALFEQALAIDPADSYSLAAYADLMLDEGHPEQVQTLLAGRTDNDNLLLRLVLAEHALRKRETEAHGELLASRYDACRLRGDTVHRREEARFVLGVRQDARAALDLARANWDVQREPWDARVLLEAAVAADDPAAAAPVLAILDETHLEDVRVRALAQRLRVAP